MVNSDFQNAELFQCGKYETTTLKIIKEEK